MKKARKVLIVKTGYSEFLEKGISTQVSLGDVLLCTVLLNLYKQDKVTWVTSSKAAPLLKDNPYISRLIMMGPDLFTQLAQESFDLMINLEKDIELSAFLVQVKVKKKYGFYFNRLTQDMDAYKRSARYLLAGQENHQDIDKSFFEILYETVGARWEGQGALLPSSHPQKEKWDIGFNYAVGPKWPTKAWPRRHWERLEQLLKDKYSLSWQRGHRDLDQYINWIAGCRLIVTSDSLAQAVGLALNKQVMTLFGPTNPQRMQGIPRVTLLRSPLRCPYMPCFHSVCRNDRFCMDDISPEIVAQNCERILS